MSRESRSAAIRAQLDHPVIDSDGHFLELVPVFLDYLKAAGGRDLAAAFEAAWGDTYISPDWYAQSEAERVDLRTVRPPFWNVPTKNTRDLATAMLPKLLYERLEEMGLDFAVLYPGIGAVAMQFGEEEVRRVTCRALNEMYADLYMPFSDRMTAVAVIPMHTPSEAIEELEYVVGTLGFKAIVMAGYVQRPIPSVARERPEAARHAVWLDTFGIDSAHDYDPVWAKCIELGVGPSFHAASIGWGSRTSISSDVYNHIGHFAAANEALCKSLFLGGVTRRFPELRCTFLEGGVGWARSLLADMVGHWEKRNHRDIANYDPENIDRELLADLFREYAGSMLEGKDLDQREALLESVTGSQEDEASRDAWHRCGIERVEDIAELFVEPFYFGCEADDPITASAFDTRANPLGASLKAVYGSDIGHWDVPDMREVTEEAFEPVEAGLISEADFRRFVFGNPVERLTALNPGFFAGTVVEQAVEDEIAGA